MEENNDGFAQPEVIQEDVLTPTKSGNGRGLSVVAIVLSLVAIGMNFSGNSTDDSSATPSPSKSTDSTVTQSNLYDTPSDLAALIHMVRESTVTLYCGKSAGSAWAMDLEDDPNSTEDDAYPVELITNEHVIHDCIDSGKLTFSPVGSSVEYEAFLYSYDEEADLAMIMTSHSVPALELAPVSRKPQIGHWVMAVGSPSSWGFNLNGSVTTGRITNIDGYVLVTDAAVNYGNSGGPLVNSRGEVVGTNSWGEDFATADNIGYAQANPALCDKEVTCDDSDWNWD